MDLVGLRFDGLFSLVKESDVRTDWLSDIGATTTDDASGLAVFWFRRALRVNVIVSTAFQSSTLSSVSAVVDSGAGGPVLVSFEWWEEG